MNHVIIVAGGIGSRMNLDIPKQFVLVNDIPVFLYSFRKFAKRNDISKIVLVISDEWKEFVEQFLNKETIKKQVLFASAGQSRQHSVWNGLRKLSDYVQDDDFVFIHDAVRPLFPESIIDDGINGCCCFDATLPVIKVKDATYQSADGETLSAILPRNELFSGQSPECFRFRKILDAHDLFTDDEIGQIRGTSELGYKAKLSVKLIKGSERNFKLTTIEDLQSFIQIINKEK